MESITAPNHRKNRRELSVIVSNGIINPEDIMEKLTMHECTFKNEKTLFYVHVNHPRFKHNKFSPKITKIMKLFSMTLELTFAFAI
ncbi:CLUMA_CG003312, isoform A [Clunio marinus]|uniref:CLUMA_CG003312, isoform A n=1 Tax=Clunio marinus TaxID=568069 RepID=A0A1J1HTN0_9DIPT|nr:CLUMA_CG003312, isoform A [Clunio marinus]